MLRLILIVLVITALSLGFAWVADEPGQPLTTTFADYLPRVSQAVSDGTRRVYAVDPDTGVAPGTKWEDVPPNWTCPDCGARKEDYELLEF